MPSSIAEVAAVIPPSQVHIQETGKEPIYVREATPADHAHMIDAAILAFIHDPLLLYWGCVQQKQGSTLAPKDIKGLRSFFSFMLKSCLSRGGRAMVVIAQSDKPNSEGKSCERVASAAYWFPPNKHISNSQIMKLVRDGTPGIVKNWGLEGFSRLGHSIDPVHSVFVNSFKQKGLNKKDVNNTWYLGMMYTHPEFQGKGCMSALMREQFALDRDGTYILETASPRARDQYMHFGFEVRKTFRIGVGKVGADGLPARGEQAEGLTMYPMIKWGKSWL